MENLAWHLGAQPPDDGARGVEARERAVGLADELLAPFERRHVPCSARTCLFIAECNLC